MENSEELKTGNESRLLNSILIVLKRIKLISWVTFGFALVAIIYSLLTPNIYQSTVRILPPPKGHAGMGALLAQMQGGGSALGDIVMANLSGPADLYAGILKGPTIADRIIDRFKLMSVYKAKLRETARENLASNTTVSVDDKTGIISISVRDRNPQRAADMANGYSDELAKALQDLAITSASRQRLFFEKQLKGAYESLTDAEIAMSKFEEKSGVIKIDEQAKTVLERIAKLQAEVAAKEIRLKVMKTYETPYNVDIHTVEAELGGLEEQLQKLQTTGNAHFQDGIIPTEQIPVKSIDYLRKFRKFKFKETLYEILLKQYEAAKMKEAKEPVSIQVIDAAKKPETKIAPIRRKIVITWTFLGCFLAVQFVFASEYFKKFMTDPSKQAAISKIKQSLFEYKTVRTIAELLRNGRKATLS